MNRQTLNAMIGQVKSFSRCLVCCETDADLFLFGMRADWITSLNCNQRHIVARWEFVSNNIPKMLFYSVHPSVWKEFYSVFFFSLNHTASISNFNFLLCLNSTTDTSSRSVLLCILHGRFKRKLLNDCLLQFFFGIWCQMSINSLFMEINAHWSTV